MQNVCCVYVFVVFELRTDSGFRVSIKEAILTSRNDTYHIAIFTIRHIFGGTMSSDGMKGDNPVVSDGNDTWVEYSDMNKTTYTSLLTCSSTLSTFLIQPLNVIMTRQQAGASITGDHAASTSNSMNVYKSLQHTIQSIGLSGLYRGILPIVLLGIPSQIIYLTITEASREKIRKLLSATSDHSHSSNDDSQPQPPTVTLTHTESSNSNTMAAVATVTDGVQSACSSILANFLSLIPYVPAEVISTRLIIQDRNSIGTIAMIRHIYNTDKGIRGFYRGFYSSFVVGSVLSAQWWFSYTIARRIGSHNQYLQSKQTVLDGCSGFVAGLSATLVAHPLDTIKTRIMTGTMSSTSMLHAFQHIVKTEGSKALWRGVIPSLYQAGISSTGFALVYEFIKRASIQDKAIK